MQVESALRDSLLLAAGLKAAGVQTRATLAVGTAALPTGAAGATATGAIKGSHSQAGPVANNDWRADDDGSCAVTVLGLAVA